MSAWLESVLERIDAALREVGVNDAVFIDGTTVRFDPSAAPSETFWRALEVSRVSDPCCFSCFEAFIGSLDALAREPRSAECDAFAYLTMDCGVER